MIRKINAIAVAAVMAFHSAALMAEDLKGEAELGFVSTTGNSESETVNAKLKLTKADEKWSHEANFAVLSNSQENQDTGESESTAEKYAASLKSDRTLDEKSFLFFLTTYEDDRFSGFDYQATLGAGYGYKIIATDERELSVEIGPGYRVSAVTDGKDEKELTLRLGENYRWKFSPTAELEQFLTVEGGEDNTISKLGVAVKASLVGSLSLKVSTVYKYTEEVPAGNEHTDTETSATVVYSF